MMTDNKFYDARETQPASEREAALMAALPAQINHARHQSAAYAELLAGVTPKDITSRAALAELPLIRKNNLTALQKKHREENGSSSLFGGLSALQPGSAMPRLFASPGPVYEPQGASLDYWRMARALYAAGFRSGELVHNTFSYHFVPGGAMLEAAAHALGCTVFAAGTGQTEQQLRVISELQPTCYCGTPSFLQTLVNRAIELNIPIPSLTKALVLAEAFPASLRDWLSTHGIVGYQCYATADIGLIAYETQAREGLVLGEDLIVEIVEPDSGRPVPEGSVGEVVVTTLNPDYPLIRFATGDLSAVLPGQCPTGRTNGRIRGWLGRSDQTTKIRGLFVHPHQITEIKRRFPEILKARLVLNGVVSNTEMTLKVEVKESPGELGARIAQAVREITQLRSDVQLNAPGTLPNDGKLIEDLRNYH